MENCTNNSYLCFNTTDDPAENKYQLSPIPVWTLVRVIVCSIGILTNSLVVFVVLHGSLRKSIFMNLLMILAVFDSLFLMAVINIRKEIFGQIFIGPSILHCSVSMFLLSVTGIASSWVTVLISLERFIALYYPFKVKIYCTKTRTFVTLMVLTIFACLYSLPYFYIADVVSSDQKHECRNIFENVIAFVFKCSTHVLYSILPFFVIAILNILMIRKLQVQKAFRLQTQGRNGVQNSAINNKSLLIMMVFVCLVFMVTTVPGAVLMIVNLSFCLWQDEDCRFGRGWHTHLRYMLEDINHSVNFFLYCITGSVFRHALFQLFRCRTSDDNLHHGVSSIQNVS